MLGSLGIDFTKWLRERRATRAPPRSATPRRSRSAAPPTSSSVIADLDKITETAAALNVPGASGSVPQKLTPQQKQAAADAIKALDGHGLHRRRRPDPAPADRQRGPQGRGSKIDAAVLLDVTFTKVGAGAVDRRPGEPEAVRRAAEGDRRRRPRRSRARRRRRRRQRRDGAQQQRARRTTWTSTPPASSRPTATGPRRASAPSCCPADPHADSHAPSAVCCGSGERGRGHFNLRHFLFSGQGWPYLLVPFIAIAIVLDLLARRPRSSSSSRRRWASCRPRR